MSKNEKTRNHFCTKVSSDMWKSTSAWNMVNRHWSLLHQKCWIMRLQIIVRPSLHS